MDAATYKFSKALYKKEDTRSIPVPEEIADIVKYLRRKNFYLYHKENPQRDFYKEIMPGSYFINMAYDFGEEFRKFVLVKIVKNKWTNFKIDYSCVLDEYNYEIKETDNVEELKQIVDEMIEKNNHLPFNPYHKKSYTINNLVEFDVKFEDFFE